MSTSPGTVISLESAGGEAPAGAPNPPAFGITDAALAAAFGAVALLAMGGDFGAAFPVGDGGLFDVICRTIAAHGFAYPDTVRFNGFQIPFSYSPLSFYAVAMLASVAHLDVPHAMNLWVCGWEIALGAVAYVAGFAIFRTRHQAAVAAAFIVLNTTLGVPLAEGGAMTRLPGLVATLGAIAAAYRFCERPRLDSAAPWIAAACVLFAAWTHMEFFALAVVSLVLLFLRFRLPLRAATALFAAIALGALPWIALAKFRIATFVAAASTSHMGAAGPNFRGVVDALGIVDGPNDAALLGTLCAIAAAFAGAWEFVVAAVVVVLLDSRAGQQVDHLWLGLAAGWAVGLLASALRTQRQQLAAITVFAILLDALYLQTRDISGSFLRLDAGDVADMHWVRDHVALDAQIVTLTVPNVSDGRREWLPALSLHASPNVFEGLEWIGLPEYRAHLAESVACNASLAACVNGLDRDALHAAYFYVAKTAGSVSPVALGFAHDARFVKVRETANSVLFTVRR